MFAHFLRDGETCRVVVLCADNPLTRRNTRQSFAGLRYVFVEFAERAALKVAEQLSRCIVADVPTLSPRQNVSDVDDGRSIVDDSFDTFCEVDG